jgi:outer membrane biosynthesis protein TonB
MISNARRIVSAPLAGAMLLALCACTSTFDVLPEKMGGLPATAPPRAAETPAFPNVYDVRPTRDDKPLNDEEQKKLQTDLVTVREQQKQLATSPPPPPPPPPKAAAAVKKEPSKTPTKTAGPEKKTEQKTAEAQKKPPKKKPEKPPEKQKDAVVPDSGPAALKPIN